jgi:MinD-like ATPase involved in chromosome partitioning or flagellar assembly
VTGDAGRPVVAAYPNSHTAEAFEKIVKNAINVTQMMALKKQEASKDSSQ